MFWLNVVFGIAENSAPNEVPMPSATTPPLSSRGVGERPIPVFATAVRSPSDSTELANANNTIAMIAVVWNDSPNSSGVGTMNQPASAIGVRSTMPRKAATI